MEDLDNIQKNFIEKVDEFIVFSKEITENIFMLANNIDNFSNNLNGLKKLPSFVDSMNTLNCKMMLLEDYSLKLNHTFSDIDRFSAIESSLKKSKEKFEEVEKRLKMLDQFLFHIHSNAQEYNFQEITEKIIEAWNKIEELNQKITSEVIEKIDEALNNNLNLIEKELQELKETFKKYEKDSEKIILELKNENKTLKEYLEQTILYNKEIIAIIKSIEKSNINAESFISELMNKWYDENVGLWGRKNKKDKIEIKKK